MDYYANDPQAVADLRDPAEEPLPTAWAISTRKVCDACKSYIMVFPSTGQEFCWDPYCGQLR